MSLKPCWANNPHLGVGSEPLGGETHTCTLDLSIASRKLMSFLICPPPQYCLSFLTKSLFFLMMPLASLSHKVSRFFLLAPWIQAVRMSPRGCILQPHLPSISSAPFYSLSPRLRATCKCYMFSLLQELLVASSSASSLPFWPSLSLPL